MKIRIVTRISVPLDIEVDIVGEKICIKRTSPEIPAVGLVKGWQPDEDIVKCSVDESVIRELYRAGKYS